MNKWLILLVVCGFILRVYAIETVPPALTWDEVAIGYNAWSILHTGADEYGHQFPILFKSFDDYKLPGMVYLTALFEYIFGLNAYAVRLPSVVAGTSMIIAGFGIARLVRDTKSGYAAALLIALSPWLISFSRQGFESNVSTALALFGLYFLLIAHKKPLNYYISGVFFSSSLYFYYSVRGVIILLLVGYLWVYCRKLRAVWKHIASASVLSCILLLPLLLVLFTDSGLARFNDVFVTNDGKYHERVDRYFVAMSTSNVPLIAQYWYSPKKAIVDEISANYMRNYSPTFMFTNGLVNHGLLYVFEAITLPIGLYLVIRSKNRHAQLLLLWFFVFPLAAAFTKDQPNPLRTLIGAPIIHIISGVGLATIYMSCTKRMKYATIGTVSGILFVSTAYFAQSYFKEMPRDRAYEFADGHREMVAYVNEKKDSYDTVYISGDRWRPYIFYLFHSEYDPSQYLETGTRYAIENIYFAGEWDKKNPPLSTSNLNEMVNGSTLFIMTTSDLQSQQARGMAFRSTVPIPGLYVPAAFWAVEI